MSATLKNRQSSIPNGYKFFQPEVRWDSTKHVGTQPSFDRLCQAVRTFRLSNPHLVQKYGWATEEGAVEAEVDAFNATLCEKLGYTDYIIGGGNAAAIPFYIASRPSPLRAAGAVLAGGRTLVDWLSSGAESVPVEKSTERAKVCATCPKNDNQGNLLDKFTGTVSEAIRETLNRRRDFQLATPYDDRLGVCQVCYCPLKLKVHLKIEEIARRLPAEEKAELEKVEPPCWIPVELKKLTT